MTTPPVFNKVRNFFSTSGIRWDSVFVVFTYKAVRLFGCVGSGKGRKP